MVRAFLFEKDSGKPRGNEGKNMGKDEPQRTQGR
jgi:hypothetical protein